MFLSVIIVNYKTKDLTLNCVHSINQNPPSCGYEILVADNCSHDGSECVANEPNTAYLPLSENKGFAHANNRALKRAKGDFILFLNPDTVVLPGTLDYCLSKLKENPKIGCVGCRVVLEDGSLDLACRRGFPTVKNALFKFLGLDKLFKNPFFSGYNLLYLPEDGEYFIDSAVGAFMMLPKKVLDAVGSFDERYFMYAEDIDLCLRLSENGYKTLYAGKKSIIHKKRASSKKSKAAKRAFYESMALYYDIHHAKNHTRLTNRLVHFGIFALEKVKG